MSMLAFGKKGTQRPPLFQRITHPRHTSPHLLWPLVQNTSALIVCDSFSPMNKTESLRGQGGQRPDEGRTGQSRAGWWRKRRGSEGRKKVKWK